MPIIGGQEWYRGQNRMLVLRQHGDDIFEVAAPASGHGQDRFDPGKLRGVNSSVLQRSNQIDVFFLIDGTSSMRPWLDAVIGTGGRSGVVQNIIHQLSLKAQSGATFRFGFRIYRDSTNARNLGIGESVLWPGTECDTPRKAALEANRRQFNEQLARVQATSEPGDDYPENTLGGLRQAIRDMDGCPENRKMLFVIGDAGYDANMQQKRGVKPETIGDLGQRMANFKQFAAYFIRPPVDTAAMPTKDKYQQAYDMFDTQAREIMRSYFQAVEQQPQTEAVRERQNPDFFVFTLEQGAVAGSSLVDKITLDVSQLTRPDIITDVDIDIRNGASLIEAINRVRDVNRDVPGYFWQMLERSACDALAEACRSRIFQGVVIRFIRADEPIELDIWMTEEQASNWNDLIARLKVPNLPFRERRNIFVQGMLNGLNSIIKEPAPPYDLGTESFRDYLMRVGHLPAGFRSPLLAYSHDELKAIPDCELYALTDWIKAAGEMIAIVRNGGLVSAKVTTDKSKWVCDRRTANSEYIPLIDGVIRKRGFAVEGGRLTFSSTGNTVTYWMPTDYMP